jgi:hypothetical protein
VEKNTTPISILAQGFTLSSFITEFVSQLITNPNQPLDQFYKNFESKMRVPHLKGKNVIFTLVITDFGEGTGPLLVMPKSASFAANYYDIEIY